MVTAVVGDIDAAFVRKMSASWLKEILANLQDRYEAVRLSGIDPETELYNRRALTSLVRCTREEYDGFLLFISTVFPRKSAAANLQKLKEIADLLLAGGSGPYFSFGYGVFGLYVPLPQRSVALKVARQLQRQLRREGMGKVQIGLGRMGVRSGETPEESLERHWHSLALAEKRGPFGLCDIDTLDAHHAHPFVLADTELFTRGRRLWRPLRSFTLALISFQQTVNAEAIAAWNGGDAKRLQKVGGVALAHRQQLLLVFPERQPQEIEKVLGAIAADAKKQFTAESFMGGVAYWPCLDFTKDEVVGNCLKAQRHAAFLEPGSVVTFDHITLNISGDYSFDEGDYRAAMREYRRGLRLQAGDVNLTNSLGVTLVECNQLRPAAQCFQDALQQEPTNYMALVNLGRVWQTLRQPKNALECFERAFAAHAGEKIAGQELFLPLATLYIMFSRFSQAITVLQQWEQRPGSDQEFLLYRLLGLSYLESGQQVKAIAACQKALRLFPQDNVSISMLGLLYVMQGEGNELGVSLCMKALALDNFNPDHWYRLGRVYQRLEQLPEALDACKHCLQLQRTHVAGTVQLGEIYRALGREAQAKRAFHRALDMKKCTEMFAKRIHRYLADK